MATRFAPRQGPPLIEINGLNFTTVKLVKSPFTLMICSMNKLKETKVALAPVPVEKLRTVCGPENLDFKSTDELQPLEQLPGQQRALNALKIGTEIKHEGYNLFVLGVQGTGRHSTVRTLLSKKACKERAPDDWVYVHNFESAHHPSAMRLPSGMAVKFRDAMDVLIEDLRSAIPNVFNSEEYRDKRRAIDHEFEEKQDLAFEALSKKAKAQDVAILRTPLGFALAPTSDGQVLKPEVFNHFPKGQRSKIEKKIEVLQKELTSVLEQLPHLQKEHRENIRALNAELTGAIVDASIKLIAEQFDAVEAIQKRLAAVRRDLIDNTEIFLAEKKIEEELPFPESPTAKRRDPRFNRYRVNVVVANDNDGDSMGAPLVIEDHPTLAKLIGRIEHLAQFGALVTDFTMIRPGALHKANGGFLVLDARKVLSEPFAWEALKRALRGQSIKIVSAADQLGLASTVSLEPEPIPLDLKVVLIGERLIYYLLCDLDPEFSDLFKIEADFDEELVRSSDNISLYARLVATIAKQEKLRPFDSPAVARIIEQTSRMADDAERLTLRVGRVRDLLREADYWAGESDNHIVSTAHVDRAVNEQIYRADRIRERSYQAIQRDLQFIDTDGEEIGQINALSVLTLGKFRFGKPSRITARVRSGRGRVIDIERETKLGGPLHSKGVLILSSYLATQFALDMPMSLWASIVFEQSYGGVDGDSASSAELYALLSALSGAPIAQSFAVTGSVNQLGEIQPIGGVNEKIEGFFDICRLKGMTGKQGVLIPASNVRHLMLKSEVIAAAKAGKFNIYPVETISQGIELLTGVTAGEKDRHGLYPVGTINRKVEEKLRVYAIQRKEFSVHDEPNSEAENA